MDWSESLPSGLAWLEGSERGRAWLREVPRLVEQCAQQWNLRLERPYPYAFTSLAVPAQLPDGSGAVLKVQFPDRENEHEAAALRLWDGAGAIKLLAEDPARHALLLERCVPGTPLADAGEGVALQVLVRLLPRLWIPTGAPPFNSLHEESSRWASNLRSRWERAGRPFEASLVDAALDALAALPSTQGEQVLLHQDLHGANVLSAQREPWLVIDPKPLVGEREFGLAPIIRSGGFGHDRRSVLRRLDYLTSALGLDRERARLWCVAQSVAWSVGEGAAPAHAEIARWLISAGRGTRRGSRNR
ncbi:MAG: aminoglycoside phosphotransferase [Chloroflexi bacterium]|nr:MAG: aminoglycoside phosphotransferase [Chloroflexota bacterium]